VWNRTAAWQGHVARMEAVLEAAAQRGAAIIDADGRLG
jgi:hypothetical protein